MLSLKIGIHVLGVLINHFFPHLIQSTRHLFTPADRRVPRIRIETRQASSLVGQRIMVAIDGWPKDSRYPNVSWNLVCLSNLWKPFYIFGEMKLLEHSR